MTARPWTAGPWKKSGSAIGPASQDDDQSNGMVIPVCYIEEYDHPNERDANARLLLATTDLAEALIAANKFLTWCIEQTPLGPAPMTGPEVLEQARAALAKAGVE